MPMTVPEPMPREEVEARLRRAGLSLLPEQVDEVHRVSGYMRRLIERIGDDRPMADEPAVIFQSRPK
jgi:hypothetical protein